MRAKELYLLVVHFQGNEDSNWIELCIAISHLDVDLLMVTHTRVK